MDTGHGTHMALTTVASRLMTVESGRRGRDRGRCQGVKGSEGKGREAGQSNAMGIKFTLVSK